MGLLACVFSSRFIQKRIPKQNLRYLSIMIIQHWLKFHFLCFGYLSVNGTVFSSTSFGHVKDSDFDFSLLLF